MVVSDLSKDVNLNMSGRNISMNCCADPSFRIHLLTMVKMKNL
jgi:hypothetical protein